VSSGHRRRIAIALFAGSLAAASVAWAQRIWVGGGRFWRTPPKWATRSNFDGEYVFCRGFFTSSRREAGGSGWDTDFPGADNNFSVRLAELTHVPVKLDKEGQPDYVVVRLSDPLLFRCPIVHMEDVGTIHFSEQEVETLRMYLLKGGFLSVEDFWGTAAWSQWVDEIGRVLPPHKYPIVDLAKNHPIWHTLYAVKELEQVSSIQFWRMSGGGVSERGPDSPHPNFRGIEDEKGRLMVVMTHNTDMPDTWEREGESQEYFDRFSPAGYAIGVNITLYALTH
jgi:hypothetical protein